MGAVCLLGYTDAVYTDGIMLSHSHWSFKTKGIKDKQ